MPRSTEVDCSSWAEESRNRHSHLHSTRQSNNLLVLVRAFYAALRVGNNSRPTQVEPSACHACAKHVALTAAQTSLRLLRGSSHLIRLAVLRSSDLIRCKPAVPIAAAAGVRTPRRRRGRLDACAAPRVGGCDGWDSACH